MKKTVITFALIVLLASIGYVLLPHAALAPVTDTQPATSSSAQVPADWLAYTNAEYGFSLSYPPTWEVQEALKPREIRALHEINIHEKEYTMMRAEASVFIFAMDNATTLDEWWNTWLADEDAKEAACKKENGDQAPCLFLRGLLQKEEHTTLAGAPAIQVEIFRFDHEESCTYIWHGQYILGLCYDGVNPNDPQEAAHKEITAGIRSSFILK